MLRLIPSLAFLCFTLVGCDIASMPPKGNVTFHQNVAPILLTRCASCHRPGEAAPFSLLTYEDAKSHSGQIVEVTRSRFMPPWLPESGHEQFANERRLTEAEINVFARWHDADTPEGDPSDAPPTPQFADGWQLGEPDLVLESPEFQLPPSGPDRFRNFVLAVPIEEARWIRAVELRPENPRVTHHVRLGIDVNGESMRRDAADQEPGYEGMAWGADPEGQLITWTPGMQPDKGTKGTAWLLAPDSKLVLHTHLQSSGKSQGVRFRIGLHFAEESPTVHPMILRIGSRYIDIPANDAGFVVRDIYTLPIDVDVGYVFPHAHSLSREIQLSAELPDGSRRTLIAIKRFDEKWHDKYRFAKPVRLPRGTRLLTQFTYDNSDNNIRNPHRPPRRVVYGSNAADEMADVYLQAIPVDPDQREVLVEHYGRYELNSKIVGYEKTLELNSQDPWSIEGLASCYVVSGAAKKAIELLESHQQVIEQSAQAATVLAAAYLADQNRAGAQALFQRVLDRDDKLPTAWLGLGQLHSQSGELNLAETALRRALRLAPRLTVARLDLIDLLIEQDRFDEAIGQGELASVMEPNSHRPHLKLANIYAQKRQYAESLKHFQKARELAPYTYSPPTSLAIACYQFGEEAKAKELLDEAVRIDPDDPVPHCFLGQIARRSEQWQAARDHLQRAVNLPLPDTWPASHVRRFLVLVYTEQLQLAEQMGDPKLAERAAEAWLRIEPDNTALTELLRDMKL